jgi:methylamine utilization protein MauE
VSAFVAGGAAACGLLLVAAGASKLYRGLRGLTSDTAVRRALRMPLRRWRVAEPVAGCAECAVGLVVCAGLLPVAGPAVMAGLGAAFCALLGYARAKGLSGGCGCIEWRAPAARAGRTVSGREIARSAVVLGVGIAAAVTAPAGATAAPIARATGNGAWFAAGLAAGSVVLVLLSAPAPWRTPVCHRPLWRPGRATLRALTGHGVYQAMAESAGPLGPLARHQAAGCADEFWFPVADGGARHRSVVFQVRYGRPGGALAVRASVRDTTP